MTGAGGESRRRLALGAFRSALSAGDAWWRCADALGALADRDGCEAAVAAEVVERLDAAGELDAVDLGDAAAVDRVAFGGLVQFHAVTRAPARRWSRDRAAGVARAREALAAAGVDLSRVVAVEPLAAGGACL